MGRNPALKLDADIAAHYESGVERQRLLKGTERLEFYRTKQILSRYLPKSPTSILDIGGGPGYYSRWLAQKGYRVHLIGPVPLHVKLARQSDSRSKRKLAEISLGDARRLPLPARSISVVLMLGPLYHLVKKQDREKALSEAFRVLRPGGVIFAAAISRFASALDGSLRGFIRDPKFVKIIQQDLRNGQHRNPENHPNYFTTAFFHRPDELEYEVRQAGFKPVKVFAVDGFAWLLPEFGKFWADKKLRKRLLQILDAIETEPSLMGESAHLLAVGWKASSKILCRPSKRKMLQKKARPRT